MLKTIDGRIVFLNGMAVESRLTGFSITVDDVGFPITNRVGNIASFGVRSKTPIRMSIIAGAETFQFESIEPFGDNYGLSITANGLPIPGFDNAFNTQIYTPVQFAQQSGGTRVITFVFEDFFAIEQLYFAYFNFHGAFPNEIVGAEKLTFLQVTGVRKLTTFPRDFSALVNLREIRLGGIGEIMFDRIPDSFFDLNIESFRASNIYNLADPISSNMFKISFWKNLKELELSQSSINDYFPEDLIEFPEKITNLRMIVNSWSQFPAWLSEFVNLTALYWGTINSANPAEWFDMSELKRLSLAFFVGDIRVDNLHEAWANLFSLSQILSMGGWRTAMNNPNTFVDSFYRLVTEGASITPNGSPAPYPNRFRNISWGSANFSFTGAKVAPDGYVQGVSNGNADTPGKQVYVLQNQYGHTITHA